MRYDTKLKLDLKETEAFHRQELFSKRFERFEPIDNPFLYLRKQANMSLQELASVSYISKNALLRAEQGTYTNPLPSLTDYWVSHSGELTHVEISNRYDQYQKETRWFNRFYFGRVPFSDLISLNNTEHPFRQLRANRIPLLGPFSNENGDFGPTKVPYSPVGITDASKALCLPLDTLQFFEKKATQKSLPQRLVEVLMYIGYDRKDIAFLAEAHQMWRKYKREGLTYDQ